jgi:hypothetical protein
MDKPKLTIIKQETAAVSVGVGMPIAEVKVGEAFAFTPRPSEEADNLRWMKGLVKGDKVAMQSPTTLYPQMALVVKVWDEIPSLEGVYGIPPGAMVQGPMPPMPDFSKVKLPVVQCAGHAFFDRTGKVVMFGDPQTDAQIEGIIFSPWLKSMSDLRRKREIVEILKGFDYSGLPLETLEEVVAAMRYGLVHGQTE